MPLPFTLIAYLFTLLAFTMANFFAPPASSTSALGPQLEPWHPESKFETFGSGLDVSELTPPGQQFDIQKVSIAFVAKRFTLNPDTIIYRNGYEDDVTKHAFLGQTHDNIPLANADAHVTFNKANKVASVSAAFVTITSTSVYPSTAAISYSAAIKTAEDTLHGTYVPPSTSNTSGAQDDKQFLEYLANQDGSLTLVYGVPVKNDSEGTYFQAYVDAQGGGVVAATNYVAH